MASNSLQTIDELLLYINSFPLQYSLNKNWIHKLNVNDKFDLCLNQKNNEYVEAEIIEKIDNEQIKIKYIESSKLKEKYIIINITSQNDNIYPLNTFTVKYTLLLSFPLYSCFSPIYYDNQYFILNTGKEYGIYKYDILNDTINRMVYYYNQIKDIDGNIHRLKTWEWDNLNNILVLKQCDDTLCIIDQTLFIQFNLKYLQWSVIENGSYNVYGGNDTLSYHSGIYIFNKLHLITDHIHCIYDENNKRFIGVNKYQKHLNAPYWLIYVKSMNLLFVFSEEINDIAYCKISHNMNINDNIWKIYDILLPQSRHSRISGCFLAFGNIIFLLFPAKSEIWCLDVMYHKFYKFMKKYPYKLRNVCFDPKNNEIHLYDSQINGYHIKININDILPFKLKQFYKHKNNLITARYLKNITNRFISNDVINIISEYFLFS